MQFVVPQFIEVEDKILGPLTVRQFVILVVGTGLIFAAYRFADFGLFILEAFFIIINMLAFAFLKVNGRPFHHFLSAFIQSLRKPKLRVWQRVVSKQELQLPKVTPPPKKEDVTKKPLTTSRLNELSLIVDTGGAFKDDAGILDETS